MISTRTTARALTLALLAGSSAIALNVTASTTAQAACELAAPAQGASANNPPSGGTVNCVDTLDTQGVSDSDANNVTVNVVGPQGGISTTGSPGILLGNGAQVTVTPGGSVRTSGSGQPAISVSQGSTVTLEENDSGSNTVVATGSSGSDAIVLRGANGTLNVNEGTLVTTSSGNSNPVQVNGADSTVNVSGDVRSSSGNATAILGTANGLEVNVRDGGFVTAQSSGSNAIESQGSMASINVEEGGEVVISSGNSAGIVSGAMGEVTIDGLVSASSSNSSGVRLSGDGASLTVGETGEIRTSSSGSQAVLIDTGVSEAIVTIDENGGEDPQINGIGGQAIVDMGNTNTTLDVNGDVFGGSSDPAISLGAGNDEVTIGETGSVEGSSSSPVIDLGDGMDSFTNNGGSLTGPGVLVSGGGGMDTFNLNGGEAATSNFDGFETTNVEGKGASLTVDNNQSGNTINANEGGRVDVADGAAAGNPTININRGGTGGITADNAEGTGSGQGGAQVNFAEGSTADVAGSGASSETQNFTGANFAPGTNVSVNNSDVLTGTATTDSAGSRIDIGLGETAFGDAADLNSRNANARAFAAALDLAVAANAALLDAAIGGGEVSLLTVGAETAAQFSVLSGEIVAQSGAAGFRAALAFTDTLRPGGLAGFGPMTAIGLEPNAYAAMPAENGGDYFADVIEAPVQSVLPAETGFWLAVHGGTVDVDEDLSSGFDADMIGVSIGAERAMSFGPFSGGTAGIALGYTHTYVDSDFDDGEIDAYHVGTYIDGEFFGLQSAAALSYSYLDIEAGDLDDAGGHVLSSRIDAAYDIGMLFDTGIVFGPVGRVEYNYATFDDVETSALLGSELDDGDISQFITGIGVRLGADVAGGTARLDVMYEHVFGDKALVFDGEVGGQNFATGAAVSDEDRLRIGAGFDVRVSPSVVVGAQYDGTFGSDVDVHTGSIRAGFRF